MTNGLVSSEMSLLLAGAGKNLKSHSLAARAEAVTSDWEKDISSSHLVSALHFRLSISRAHKTLTLFVFNLKRKQIIKTLAAQRNTDSHNSFSKQHL
jgi:hypothetical protein